MLNNFSTTVLNDIAQSLEELLSFPSLLGSNGLCWYLHTNIADWPPYTEVWPQSSNKDGFVAYRLVSHYIKRLNLSLEGSHLPSPGTLTPERRALCLLILEDIQLELEKR